MKVEDRIFLLKSLYENGEMDSNELINSYYIENPQVIENRKQIYIEKNIKKDLRSQLRAELTAMVHLDWNDDIIVLVYGTWNKKHKYVHFILTDKGRKYYENNFLKSNT